MNIALAIYVMMDRDPSDALDMIAECTDVSTLELLRDMLTGKGTERTDRELNQLMLGPVTRRLSTLQDKS